MDKCSRTNCNNEAIYALCDGYRITGINLCEKCLKEIREIKKLKYKNYKK